MDDDNFCFCTTCGEHVTHIDGKCQICGTENRAKPANELADQPPSPAATSSS